MSELRCSLAKVGGSFFAKRRYLRGSEVLSDGVLSETTARIACWAVRSVATSM